MTALADPLTLAEAARIGPVVAEDEATTGLESVKNASRRRSREDGDLQGVHRLPVGSFSHALVDRDVYAWAKKVHWGLHQSDTTVYAAHRTSFADGYVRVFLHRVILGLAPDDSRRVDHLNGDTLDNRRANLRIASTAENAQNQGSRGGSSKYRGVTWDRSRGKWTASAMLNGKRTTIGRFVTEDEAGAAAAGWRAQHMPFSSDARTA